MPIVGIVQTTKSNDWGFTSYKVSNTWYGADTKGPPRASEGDKITFEAYEKAGKDGRTYPTIKLATFKKLSKEANESSQDATSTRAAAAVTSNANAQGSKPSFVRDAYWQDKAAEDKLREPRIVYQAAYERALQFVDLAIRNGAFAALEKAKPAGKLEILEAFVNEQTDKILRQAFAAAVPKPENAKPADEPAELESDLPETDEAWA
jgi:hypothetical protein